MGDVSVIGCGVMGSALIKTLAEKNNRVTIWNRTREKAQVLAGPLITVAATIDDTLAASPLTIVCVADQDVTRTLLEGAAAENLRRRTVVSTAFVTLEQARDLDDLVAGAGGQYLDLAIAGYPSQVGTDAAFLLLSGDRGSFDEHRQQFDQLGKASYVDDDPGAAFVSEMAVLLPYLPMAVSLLQGAKICERRGLSLQWYAETVPQILRFHIGLLLEGITHAQDSSARERVEASVRVWGDGAAEYADYLRVLNLDSGMYDALARLFAAGVEAGRADHDWRCIAEVTATDEAPRH